MSGQISEASRSEVWHELLEVSRLARYHGAMAARHTRHSNIVRIVLAFSGTGAATGASGLLANFSAWVGGIGGVVIAVLIIWDLVYRPAEKAARFEAATRLLLAVELDQRRLWVTVQNGEIDAEGIELRLKNIRERIYFVTNVLISSGEDKTLNEKCWKEAIDVELGRYAS